MPTTQTKEEICKQFDLYVGKPWPHTSLLENGQTIVIEDKIKSLHYNGGEVCIDTEKGYYGPHWIFKHDTDLNNTAIQ